MAQKSRRLSAKYGICRSALRAFGLDGFFAGCDFSLEPFDAGLKIVDRRIFQLRFERERFAYCRSERIVVDHWGQPPGPT